MKLNFDGVAQYIQLAMVGVLVAQKVAKDAAGQSKKDTALEALNAAAQIASAALPDKAPAIQMTETAASQAIEAAVAILKLAGHPDFGTAAPTTT